MQKRLSLTYLTFKYCIKLSGVQKKIEGQISALNNIGLKANLIQVNSPFPFSYIRMIRTINKINSDILYVRNFETSFLLFLPFIIKLKKTKLLVLEIPTALSSAHKEIVYGNYNILKKCIKLFMFKITFPFVLKFFDIIISIVQNDSYVSNCRNAIAINNGIDLSNIKLKKYIISDSLNIIAVSNISIWNGFDRVITGLKNYYASKPDIEVFFHIVGEGNAINELLQLTKEYNLAKYVIFHGRKHGKELDNIFDFCNLAISSLGLHRINVFKSANLKAREYCARGVPFVLSSEDADFPQYIPFVYRVSADDSPLDIHKLINFYNKINLDKNIRFKIRKYAENNLTWESKMLELYKLFLSELKAKDIFNSKATCNS